MLTLIIKYSLNLLNYFLNFSEIYSSVAGVYLSIVIDLASLYLCGDA